MSASQDNCLQNAHLLARVAVENDYVSDPQNNLSMVSAESGLSFGWEEDFNLTLPLNHQPGTMGKSARWMPIDR